MKTSSFLQFGDTPTLEEVLENRENRVNFINKLLELHPRFTVISFKLNIPGPVKNNEKIREIFNRGVSSILSSINKENWTSVYNKILNIKTGPEYFNVVDADCLEVKKSMTEIEESEILGRIFDIDVLFSENEKPMNINREAVGYGGRKCFVCNNDAKICASRRIHSLEEMYESLENIVNKANM